MTTYAYTAVDSQGRETTGKIEVPDQNAALQRLKEMGFFPTKLSAIQAPLPPAARAQRHLQPLGLKSKTAITTADRFRGRIKSRHLAIFTRQLATLVDAGLPLPRSLRLLQEQQEYPPLKSLIPALVVLIEGGATFSEALAQYPRVFNSLFVNMVKAGEIGGMLETTLGRLADFMEKSGRIRGKVKAALVYPAAVMTAAAGLVTLMLLFVIPKFKEVFLSLGEGRPLPSFTLWVFGTADALKNHFLLVALAVAAPCFLFSLAIRTRLGRELFDHSKLRAPVVGPVFRKLAVSRFARTLGTLLANGVPVLQALQIVREAAGNVVVGRVVAQVRENVKQGETIAGPLRQSGIFPAMVAGMVDVGEQTGALPEMLCRIADGYDEEVDNAVAGMVSLLEPIVIVLLAVVVGAIVLATFLPLMHIMDPPPVPGAGGETP